MYRSRKCRARTGQVAKVYGSRKGKSRKDQHPGRLSNGPGPDFQKYYSWQEFYCSYPLKTNMAAFVKLDGNVYGTASSLLDG